MVLLNTSLSLFELLGRSHSSLPQVYPELPGKISRCRAILYLRGLCPKEYTQSDVPRPRSLSRYVPKTVSLVFPVT